MGCHLDYVVVLTADPRAPDGEAFLGAIEAFASRHDEGSMVRRISPYRLTFHAAGVRLIAEVDMASRSIDGVEVTLGQLPAGPRRETPKGEDAVVDPPAWALRLLPAPDAVRYRSEWRAHLSERYADGESRCARRDRRRFVLRAPSLALELRMRALLRRLRRQVR